MNRGLFFSVGGMISLSGCMAGGITMVIRCDSVPILFYCFKNMICTSLFITSWPRSSCHLFWEYNYQGQILCLQLLERLCEVQGLYRLQFGQRNKILCRWQQPSTLGRSAATWSTRPRALKKILIKSEWCLEMGWDLTFGPSSFPGRVILWNPKVPKVEQHLFRFGIQDISEFYGSTEGNSNIINFDNTVGAVGFVPVLFAGILPLGPIKVGNQESYLSFW